MEITKEFEINKVIPQIFTEMVKITRGLLENYDSVDFIEGEQKLYHDEVLDLLRLTRELLICIEPEHDTISVVSHLKSYLSGLPKILADLEMPEYQWLIVTISELYSYLCQDLAYEDDILESVVEITRASLKSFYTMGLKVTPGMLRFWLDGKDDLESERTLNAILIFFTHAEQERAAQEDDTVTLKHPVVKHLFSFAKDLH